MKMKALIYCSVSKTDRKELLVYQEKILSFITIELGYEIFAVCMDSINSNDLDSYAIQKALMHIKRKDIDVVIIWDYTRISSDLRIYEEFRMFSLINNVEVILLSEILKSIKLIDN